jgi:hypothetical protein
MTRSDNHKAPAPLRAGPRHPGPAAGAAVAGLEASSGGLIRSTLKAAAAAGAVLVVFYLPAEYGVDPTGLGSVIGLTGMGAIKQQLHAEDAADAAGLAAQEAAERAEMLARLRAIETQVAAISATIGAEIAMPAAPGRPAAALPAAAAPPPAPAPTPAPEWRDEVSYRLNPGEGIEVKLAMQAGEVARFEWTAHGGVVNFDLHGEGGGQKISYEQGRAVPGAAGELIAAFSGNHGWFWRNRTAAPVTVTLRTGGDYRALRGP